MKLDFAINYACYWLLFVVSTLKQALKECKTFDFSVFAAMSSAVAFKEGKWTMCRMKNQLFYILPYGRFIQSKQVDKVTPLHDPLKTLKLKTLASDCIIKKDVTTMPLLIYYDELYVVHPLISALILET